jgi:hypothetical protein
MDIVRIAKELREQVNLLPVATRHNPALGIMPSIFSAATRRDPQELRIDFVCRGGGLKMDWTKPSGEYYDYGD